MFSRLFWLSLLFQFSFSIGAQSVDFLIGSEEDQIIEKIAIKNNLNIHLDFKGRNYLDLPLNDSLFKTFSENNLKAVVHKKYYGINSTSSGLKFVNIFQKKIDNSFISINPVFNFEQGNRSFGNHWFNTRGVELIGNLNKQVGIYSLFRENQFSFYNYVNTLSNYYNNTIPFIGRIVHSLPDGGADAPESEGYITFSPLKSIQFKFGKYKNFIGNGIRSLMLSDAANSYLNLNTRLKIWKLEYRIIHAEFLDYPNYLNPPNSSMIVRKHGVFHYISAKIKKNIGIGLFESIIYHRGDSLKNGGIDWNYLNPVIMYRPIENYIGSPDNAVLGMNFYYNFKSKYQLYSQFILDEFNVSQLFFNNTKWWANKYGVQIGIKAFDFLNIKDLDLISEFNTVRPYTYSYRSTEESYSHGSLPLAHILGANFKEVVSTLNYQINSRLNINIVYSFYHKGLDLNGENFGGDILRNYWDRSEDFGHFTTQGLGQKVNYISLITSYKLTKICHLDASYIYRSDSIFGNSNLVRVGIRYNMPYRSYVF